MNLDLCEQTSGGAKGMQKDTAARIRSLARETWKTLAERTHILLDALSSLRDADVIDVLKATNTKATEEALQGVLSDIFAEASRQEIFRAAKLGKMIAFLQSRPDLPQMVVLLGVLSHLTNAQLEKAAKSALQKAQFAALLHALDRMTEVAVEKQFLDV